LRKSEKSKYFFRQKSEKSKKKSKKFKDFFEDVIRTPYSGVNNPSAKYSNYLTARAAHKSHLPEFGPVFNVVDLRHVAVRQFLHFGDFFVRK
jgi:hypothetical protein